MGTEIRIIFCEKISSHNYVATLIPRRGNASYMTSVWFKDLPCVQLSTAFEKLLPSEGL